MNTDTLKIAVQISFALVILFLAIVSLFSAYVFIRYGRTPSITILSSLVFGGIFVLGTITAYVQLINIF